MRAVRDMHAGCHARSQSLAHGIYDSFPKAFGSTVNAACGLMISFRMDAHRCYTSDSYYSGTQCIMYSLDEQDTDDGSAYLDQQGPETLWVRGLATLSWRMSSMLCPAIAGSACWGQGGAWVGVREGRGSHSCPQQTPKSPSVYWLFRLVDSTYTAA